MPAFNLKTKMTLSVSLLTAILLSILAFSAQLYFVDQIKKLVSSQQFTMVSAIADQVDDKMLALQTELVATAGTLDKDVIDTPSKRQIFFANRPDTLSMFDNGLFLFSAQGDLLAGNRVEPAMLATNYTQRPFLKNTFATRTAQISEPFISVQTHRHPVIMFTAPIFDKRGELIAVLGGSLDLTKNNFLGKLGSIRLGEKGYLYLYNNSRVMIVHPDRERIFKQDVPPGANLMYDRAINGYQGTGETVNSRKMHVISSFKRLKSTGWILASNFPQDEAYAPAYRVQRYLLTALLVVFLVSILVAWLSMRHLTAPLISFTSQIRALTHKGDASPSRIRIETGDEIGVLGEAFNLLLEELEDQKKELKKQLDFSQILIDTMPVPAFYKDAQGKYLGCNKAFEDFTGFSKSYMIGKSVFDIAPLKLAEIYHQADVDLSSKSGLQIYETSAVHIDSTRHDVIFYKTTFPATDGKFGGVIGAMLDITERKGAESALQAQKEFAESLVLNFIMPTFVLDCRHRVIIWNHACEALTGVKASEVLGSDQLWSVFYDHQRPLLSDMIIAGNLDALSQYYPIHSKSSQIPEGVQAEGSFRDPQGNWHYITLNAAPIRDSGGGVIGAIQTIEDITERKQAQDAHEKTRRKLQLILDAAGEGIYGVDTQGMVTFVNPAAAQMVGWEQQELLGRHQHSLMHHTRADGTPYPEEECPIHAVFHEGVARHGDELFWRKDGTSFSVEYMSSPIRENGALVGAVVTFKDTTERNLAEEQLLKLSQAVMQSPVSIVITDTSGKVEFVNPKFSQLSGYQVAEVIGENPRLFKSGKTPPEVYQNLWSTITSGRVWSGELYNRQKNGTTYWEHATISPIRNSAGTISHYMAFMESMTERKRLEEQLRQSQKMEAIGQLAGGVAHDFNNILTVIMGYGQILQYSLPADDPKHSHMDQILDAADRAAHLTKSLLAFSRKQVMLLHHLELNELARKHTKFLMRIIGEDVTLKTIFAEEPLVILADSGQIEQVLMNLATNARDAMPGGGELCITTESIQLDKEFYKLHGYGIPGRYALITVTDTGSGMDTETREKIFEPFFTTKAPGRGTGLGLSIVYGIVKQHGGYITIISQCGLGTTFSIYLPLIAEHKEIESKAPALLPKGGKETILVVEDDPAVRNLVESVLKTFGYGVILAGSGDEAIELFASHWQNIDLALLDVVMPKLNGVQVCEILRQRSPHLKVLFLSGYTADLIQDKGILVEGIEILLKPAQPAELARKVREMLDAV